MKTFTPGHRDVLVRVKVHGARVADAARVPDVAPGTVNSRVYYAMRALRRVLPEYAADLR